MISRRLVEGVQDEDSLLVLLKTAQENGGLGWQVSGEFAFEETPEIAQGVQGEAKARVSRLIPSGTDGEWLILLAEFDQDFKRRDLREILRSLRAYARETAKFPDHTGYGDTLFIVANPGYQEVRFVLFQQQEGRQARIRSFGWSKGEIGRTLLQHNLPGVYWSQLVSWLKAWDVEELTKQFFRDYREVFYEVEDAAFTLFNDKETARRFTQTFLNRLIFICFLQKKNWMEAPGASARSRYLFDLYDNFQPVTTGPDPERGFFDRLRILFFSGLNAVNGQGGGTSPEMTERIGRVPFLNGGLFERDDVLDRQDIFLPDRLLEKIVGRDGLLRRYNFTITESTPDDVMVALDPELLGKVFEELVNDRHGTGSYYTPRPIVSFMCREAIKGYLGGYAELVDQQSTLGISIDEAKALIKRLEAVRVCDPACGSGAYLVGMLYELEALLTLLDTRAEQATARDAHERRLRIIEDCLYGVDIQKFAVNIAWLRLWLALIIEDKRNPLDEPDVDVSLPNLDVKIGVGDSLLAPVKHGSLADMEARKLAKTKAAYMEAHTKEEKQALRDELREHRRQLQSLYNHEVPEGVFDWMVEFAEVWVEDEPEATIGGSFNLGTAASTPELTERSVRGGGFDIIVANPPYINAREIVQTCGSSYKPRLKARFPSSFDGSADLLVYFMDRAIELLRPGGQFAFITSNLWLKAGYGKKIRGHMVKCTHIRHLIDFRHLPVFQGTMAFPLITLASKHSHQDSLAAKTRLTRVTSLDAPYPDMHAIIKQSGGELPNGSLQASGEWSLEVGESAQRMAQMRARGIPLGEYIQGKIYYGIKTGLNEVKIGSDGKMYGKRVPTGVRVVRKEGVFVINGAKRGELIAEDPKSAEIIMPLAIGRDVRRWVVEDNDRWLIVTKIGTDMSLYPAVMRHLAKYEALLRPRADQGEHWWELRACAYWDAFEGQKLVWGNLNNQPCYASAGPGVYLNAPAVMMAPEELFVLGILNSRAGWKKLTEIAYARNGGYFETKPVFVKQVEIPFTSQEDKFRIEALVRDILDLKNHNPSSDVGELEAEIDARVEFLYFHRGERGTRTNDAGEEVPYPDTYDEWVTLREAEAGTIVAEIRQLIAKGESGTVEFKESLEYVDPGSLSHVPEAHRNQRLAELKTNVLHSALKTICAFANTKGGTLLIGVHDSGDLWGLDGDFELSGGKRDQDAFENRLTDFIKTRIRPLLTELEIAVVKVDGKWVCRVHVPAAKAPHYLDNRLYIRLGNSTEELAGRDLEDWLANR